MRRTTRSTAPNMISGITATISQSERRRPMNGRLITIVATGIAAMAALVASAVSADVIPEPGALVDQANLLAEDVGETGIYADEDISLRFSVGAVQNSIDYSKLGFFEPDRPNWPKLLEPTYRAPVLGAEMVTETCGYYPWASVCTEEDMSSRFSVGVVQNSVDDGVIGLLQLDGERDWIKMVAPNYPSGRMGAEMLEETCGYYPWACAARSEGL